MPDQRLIRTGFVVSGLINVVGVLATFYDQKTRRGTRGHRAVFDL